MTFDVANQPGSMRGGRSSRRLRLPVIAFLAALCAVLLFTQNAKMGFERGHHGWVSSHVLAIAQHAYPSSGFVGYAVQSIDQEGQVQYAYFDRYPVPFSAVLHYLLQTTPQAAAQIYLSRQFMNLVFFASLVVACLLLNRLTGDPLLSLSAALLAFSGYYFMFFKDMVHFDQPAVLGVMLLLYGMVAFQQTRRAWPLYLFAAVALSLGRAYPAMAVISIWLLLEMLRAVREQSWRAAGVVAALRVSRAPQLFAFGLLLSSGYLAYNVAMESAVRDVSITETSIIDSALRRLGIDESFTSKRDQPLTWSAHAKSQAERLVVGAIPYPFGVPDEYKRSVEYLITRAGLPAVVLVIVFGAGLMAHFILRQPPANRRWWLLLVLSGFAWVIPMKNLTLPHNYTAIYYLGLHLTFFSAMLSLLPLRWRPYTLGTAGVVFLASNLSVNAFHDNSAARLNVITRDFQVMRDLLAPGAKVFLFAPGKLRLDGSVAIVEGAPYAPAFYLPEQFLSPLEHADYAVSRDRSQLCPEEIECELLTPNNDVMFLSRVQKVR